MAEPQTLSNAPELSGDAAQAVAHRGGHLQIIASAGAGKTEVVSQRVASLVEDGEKPDGIVAFTFTEKAARELKERIRARVEARVGSEATDRLGQLQVGTIHGYCFRLLQTWVPRFETYSLVDENQLVSLLLREGGPNRLNLGRFGPGGKGLFKGIATFLRSVDVVENELLELDALPAGEFKETLIDYYEMLERYRLLTFGLQIRHAVEALETESIHSAVTANLKHLIVDEYQDVNPAQERLIELLAKPYGSADLVVVGDDDQAIYQWRGSNVKNIVSFDTRYPDVKQFRLLKNRRSRPGIVQLANSFSSTIEGRLPKAMEVDRPEVGPSIEIAAAYTDEAQEAEFLAMRIQALAEEGIPYRAMAVLVRGRVAYDEILKAFDAHGVPVQPGGRTGLFQQDVAAILGATYAWLSGIEWAPSRFMKRAAVDIETLVEGFERVFGLGESESSLLREHLETWKLRVPLTDKSVNLMSELYELLALAGVRDWNLDDPATRNRLGTLARLSAVLADYETVTRRSRADQKNPGEQVGGNDRGEWYYRNLALLLVNYATGSYDDFDGDADEVTDAVDLGTVHGAKGLEWPVVFLPSLTSRRFPSSKTGQSATWLLPTELFDVERYEGTDADERRLFYVAVTRARDWLSLSSHRKLKKQAARPSPYLSHAIDHVGETGPPELGAGGQPIELPDTNFTYSELAAYMNCPQSYLLRNRLGFMPPVAAELGYGNAIHHLMRAVAEQAKANGALPSPREINKLLETDFFLPFANKPAHREMREQARELVFSYVNNHQSELMRTWATERPFELYLDGVVITGRADVIYDEHEGTVDNLAIVDYKTKTGVEVEPLQLQIYADAGRREGLAVGAAFVHDMGGATRHQVPITPSDIYRAEQTVLETVKKLKDGDFSPKPEVSKCGRCDVRQVCKAAKLKR